MFAPVPGLNTLRVSSLPPKGLKLSIFAPRSLCEIRLESTLRIVQGFHYKFKWSACNVESMSLQTIYDSMSSHGWSKICPWVKIFDVYSSLIWSTKMGGVQLYEQQSPLNVVYLHNISLQYSSATKIIEELVRIVSWSAWDDGSWFRSCSNIN